MNSPQNFPLLRGQQTNLYKCVIENGFGQLSPQGLMGLIHPEGVYDDINGQAIRSEIYQRLRYHFHFVNELGLFTEVHDNMSFSINVYHGTKSEVNFLSIQYLFNPSTIEGIFIHNGLGEMGGIKIKDEITNKYVWNTNPHSKRKVTMNKESLQVISDSIENSGSYKTTKLIGVYSKEFIPILEKIGHFNKSVKDFESKISEGWHETNDVNAGNIFRNTKYPNVVDYDMIYSGPHLHVSNPMYKTPKSICKLRSDYDTIDIGIIEQDYIARSNYSPVNKNTEYLDAIQGFSKGFDGKGNILYDRWIGYYKLGLRKMVWDGGERTLIGAILPQNASHVNGIISIIFKDESNLIEATALCSSIVLDFLVKCLGVDNLTSSRILGFPLGIPSRYKSAIFARTLLLNCVNKYYSNLWNSQWQSTFNNQLWSQNDRRFKVFADLDSAWSRTVPLRNWLERRQALVEIDVLSAMALGLTLSELELLYKVQFPVLQQNEDDTWYDQKGNIVFTFSKGLSGVGLDRGDWKIIQHRKEGEDYEHTITKSELYQGQKVTYYPPFEKRNRIADYRVAWAHFESTLPAK